jgi:hypothetical protein
MTAGPSQRIGFRPQRAQRVGYTPTGNRPRATGSTTGSRSPGSRQQPTRGSGRPGVPGAACHRTTSHTARASSDVAAERQASIEIRQSSAGYSVRIPSAETALLHHHDPEAPADAGGAIGLDDHHNSSPNLGELSLTEAERTLREFRSPASRCRPRRSSRSARHRRLLGQERATNSLRFSDLRRERPTGTLTRRGPAQVPVTAPAPD